MNNMRLKGTMKTLLLLSSMFLSISFAKAQDGATLFKTKCLACHNTGTQKGVGPGLKGITEKRDKEWLYKWVKNSTEMVQSGDADAVAIFEEYNKAPMLSFDLSNEEIDAILTYINDENAPKDPAIAAADDGGGDTASSEPMSPYLKVTFWILLVLALLAIFVFYRVSKYAKRALSSMGYYPEPFRRKKRGLTFLIMLLIAGLVILLLTAGLDAEFGRINTLMFLMFPYATLMVFFIGSIYRYKKTGFQVSSLSSQFLEGKQLFFGSQPFHWGLFVLFFGHLLAFVFPKTVMAWNGEPVRLLILELSSFAFALLALAGLIMLIKRRMLSRRILEVTNKMDMLVYVVLLVQILSGLGVAFFVRWGSSWFAAVLTPYLRSIFTLSPDIAAISAAPLLIQIHIISAFFIIAILPFTRFMHFLVAPLDYIWRSEQLVFWNWNRKMIRKTKRYFFGHKPRNH